MPTLKKDEVEKELEDLNKQLEEEEKDPTIKTHEESPEEKVDDKSVEKKEEEPETDETISSESPPSDSPSADEDKEEDKAELEDEEKLKKKLSASARENQKILAKNRKLNQAIVDSTGIAEPTDEEMQKEFVDWDIMSETEQKLAKDTIINRKWRENIAKAQQESEKIEKWGEEVTKFIEDPQVLLDNPQLEGKQDEFKEFATSEENNNVPFKILVGAFLFEQQSKKVEHKGQMLPTGQGGDKEKPARQDGKISFEEGEALKIRDYKKWKELLTADKIADPEL